MKSFAALILAWGVTATGPTSFAQSPLLPATNFTLRDDDVNGTADLVDATPDNSGFDGYLTVNNDPFQEDRHYAEFNMALLPTSWASTALAFTTDFNGVTAPPGTLQVSYYVGNGSPDPSKWSISTIELVTLPGITGDGGQSFVIDVSSLASSYGGSGFLGFRFELIDSQLNQKELLASSITLIEVPEPATALVCIIGIALLTLWRRQAFVGLTRV